MNNKKWYQLVTVLYLFWLLVSFGLIYFLMTKEVGIWHSSSYAFIKYLIFVQPISMLGVAYILTKGHLRDITNKLKPFIVTSSVLLVMAFTMIQWTSLTTNYGQYGASVKHSQNDSFLLPNDVTSFEKATLYREAVRLKYETTFNKIWTFDFIILFGSLLIVCCLRKNDID